MLNLYQKSVLEYFETCEHPFIEFLTKPAKRNKLAKIIGEDKIVPISATFLDTQLWTELQIVAEKCRRHDELNDMLIEVHMLEIPSVFATEIKQTAQKLLLPALPLLQ